MSPDLVLGFLANFRGDSTLSELRIVFLQEITAQGGPRFDSNDVWMLVHVHGKLQQEWRGCGVAFLKILGTHCRTSLQLAACTSCLRLSDSNKGSRSRPRSHVA